MWWHQRSASEVPTGPRVVDYRILPSGVAPAHLQQWVIVAIVLGMVTILSLSTPPSPKLRTAAGANGATPIVDANQQRIEDYQRRVQEQAQRLAAEQAALERAKDTLATGVKTTGGAARASTRDGFARSQTRAAPADNVAFTRPTGEAGSPPSVPRDPARLLVAPVPKAAPDAPPNPRESTYRLGEGTIIETVLTNRLDGTFAAPVNCLVTTPAYDDDIRRLLIPAGARVLGEARPVSTFGQSRLAVTFHRLVMPNGRRFDLNGFHGLNQAGDEGLQDQVNRHYAQIFGASLAVGAIAGLAEAQSSVGVDAGSGDLYRQSAAANLAQSSARILDRFLNLLPTVTIREGHRIKVYLSNDLELPAYDDHLQTGARP